MDGESAPHLRTNIQFHSIDEVVYGVESQCSGCHMSFKYIEIDVGIRTTVAFDR